MSSYSKQHAVYLVTGERISIHSVLTSLRYYTTVTAVGYSFTLPRVPYKVFCLYMHA